MRPSTPRSVSSTTWTSTCRRSMPSSAPTWSVTGMRPCRQDTSFQWQEIGHAYYMLARGKARILPIPYVVREINYGYSDHNTEIYHSLTHTDAKSVAEREAFADFLFGLPTQIQAEDADQARQFALKASKPWSIACVPVVH